MDEIKIETKSRQYHTHQRKTVFLRRTEHRISKNNIDPDAQKIIYRLKNQGFIAYLTGAAVQNLLQGIPPKDFDLVTDARPGQIKRRFGNSILIGKRFRLVHIIFKKGKFIEVATFRKAPDIVDKGESGSDITRKSTYGTPQQDAYRRDISINALYYDVSTAVVIDYVGGLKDLAEKRIRIIGDPRERFTEDPVRILRVVRHAARLGFDIEKKTEAAIFFSRHFLSECSSSRLYEELNKDLADTTRPIFKSYNRFGLLKYLLGQVGEDYQNDHDLSSRLFSLLDIKDLARSRNFSFLQEEIYALIFWPWVERQFADKKGDIQKTLKEAITTALGRINVPRKLRSDFLQILILIRNMRWALKTNQKRQSWKRRPQYSSASRLIFLIDEGRAPGKDESFEKLFKRLNQSKHNQQRDRSPNHYKSDQNRTR